MQYPVPQFIDTEDKIIGPLTLKQFGIIFGTGLLDVVFFRILQLSIPFFVLAVPVTLVGLIAALAPFNGRQMYQVVPMFLRYISQPRIYVFKHEAPSVNSFNLSFAMKKKIQNSGAVVGSDVDKLESPQSKLKRLSLLLDQQQQTESDLINRNYYGQQD